MGTNPNLLRYVHAVQAELMLMQIQRSPVSGNHVHAGIRVGIGQTNCGPVVEWQYSEDEPDFGHIVLVNWQGRHLRAPLTDVMLADIQSCVHPRCYSRGNPDRGPFAVRSLDMTWSQELQHPDSLVDDHREMEFHDVRDRLHWDLLNAAAARRPRDERLPGQHDAACPEGCSCRWDKAARQVLTWERPSMIRVGTWRYWIEPVGQHVA
jgi:hypothetical protein